MPKSARMLWIWRDDQLKVTNGESCPEMRVGDWPFICSSSSPWFFLLDRLVYSEPSPEGTNLLGFYIIEDLTFWWVFAKLSALHAVFLHDLYVVSEICNFSFQRTQRFHLKRNSSVEKSLTSWVFFNYIKYINLLPNLLLNNCYQCHLQDYKNILIIRNTSSEV